MKKIGILFGQERSFPMAFIERINSKGIENISAEPVRIDKSAQGLNSGYAVIVDRISQDVPFYRTFLKNEAVTGTAVINNPFWWSADDKYFNNCLMTQIGVPVPKTVILPSYELPTDTKSESFSNLAYPLDWDGIFNYVGFPAYMKHQYWKPLKLTRIKPIIIKNIPQYLIHLPPFQNKFQNEHSFKNLLKYHYSLFISFRLFSKNGGRPDCTTWNHLYG